MTGELSEFEGCVLGHLTRHGPATAYSIRRAFLVSPSSHWSGSAGAMYPLLERLEKRRLVSSRRAPTGGREAWLYSATPAGRERFQSWLQPPFAAELISIPPDPLRTRVHFLGLLSRPRRAAFLRAALDGLHRHRQALEAEVAGNEDDRQALRGALLVTRARIDWLAGLQRSVRTKNARK